jgi:ABC-type thiamin/hydroxymethylpyrimidine transport system permease subunit
MLDQLIAPLTGAAAAFDSITVDPLVEIIGLPHDQLRLFVIWLLQFPIGYFLHFCVHGALARHLMNTLLGVIGMSYFYGWDIKHVLFMGLGSYLLMALAPRDKSQIYVSIYAFGYLSVSHIHAVLYHFGSYDLEITTNTMLLTLRLIALAFSYHDGGQDEK